MKLLQGLETLVAQPQLPAALPLSPAPSSTAEIPLNLAITGCSKLRKSMIIVVLNTMGRGFVLEKIEILYLRAR